MSELENLIRKIVREEIQLYLQQNQEEVTSGQVNKEPMEQSETQENVKNQEEIDYELFEKRYEEALQIDDQVREKYKSQVDKHGSVVNLKNASEILNLSVYAIRKLGKTDKNFPKIYSAKVDTARLFHWLDGGKAYWNIGEDND
ncbi:hypothetical protein HUN92_03780 [Bacillus firmus]|uniref:hypothetical protein n=1 Tax=Cytobacillus TaxID=2675230 RepID=UPI0011A255A4|nr:MULTISPECIES: hypothetical protein [Cytobacillus]MBZ9534522.1 hypothetical protein [Cytobacillus oceanisediminis]NUH82904.1 hypothetical protein [Cytobacillus firmus]